MAPSLKDGTLRKIPNILPDIESTGDLQMVAQGKVYIVIEKDNLSDPVYEVFGTEAEYLQWYRDLIRGNGDQYYDGPGPEYYNERFMTVTRTVNFSLSVNINE